MIKQMESRFMAIAVTAISLVMLVILIMVNIITAQRDIQSADEILDRQKVIPLERPDILPKGPDHDGLLDRNDRRSFFVYIDQDGNMLATDAYDKNIFTEEEAYIIMEEAAGDDGDYGFAGDFRYAREIRNDGQVLYVFLDYSFEKEGQQNLLYISILVFFASVCLVALLVKLLLRPFMKPIRNTYSKQKRFITDASHELKTPLTVIATNMQLIEMENGPSDWTASVTKQTERLKTLTNELVALARMDEEGSQLIKSDLDLSEMVMDVVMGFDPAFSAQGKTLKTSIEEGLTYHGDYDSLERVISVLLSNAMKYSDNRGRTEVKLKRDGKRIKLKVINTTETIEQGSHSEYFERFYRSDASRNSETGGFGIGLAIAKATVEEHKGKIDAYSKDGKSLIVSVIL